MIGQATRAQATPVFGPMLVLFCGRLIGLHGWHVDPAREALLPVLTRFKFLRRFPFPRLLPSDRQRRHQFQWQEIDGEYRRRHVPAEQFMMFLCLLYWLSRIAQ